MAGDGSGDPFLRRIQEELRRRIGTHQEANHLLRQQAQLSGGVRMRKHIHLRFCLLTPRLCRFRKERAQIRKRERNLRRIYHGRRSAGYPASSLHETGVEEHAGKVRSSELGGTSTDLSKFDAVNIDASHTVELESVERVEEHAGKVMSSELGGTSADLSKFDALNIDASHTVELEPVDRVEEHAGEVRSGEPVGTSTDLSKFEAPMLNHTPQTAESADRVAMHVDTVESGMLDSKSADLSALHKKKPSEIPRKYWPPKNEGDISFAERQAEKEYEESQAQSLQARGRNTYASKEEIARNAKKWMSEEAMVAFRRYIGSEDHLKELEYEFKELLHQCFNVEHYFKIFHHFNFTVKIRKRGSTDWTLLTCFAEVKAILQTKHYVCYTLDADENGQCYACQNQGMHELRHPSVDIFDCGKEDTTFPYYCEESDSDESHPEVGECESEDDMS